MSGHIQKEHTWAGQGAIFLCAALWSTSGLFIKLVPWHPVVIAGSRSFLAAIFLTALRFLPKKHSAGFPRRTSWPLAVTGGFCYAATMILFVVANKLTASANAILLQYTAPVWAALLAWLFLREIPRWEYWCALALTGAGMFLVFNGGLSAGSMLGGMTALASGIFFAANSVVMRKQKDGSPADTMICAHVLTALFSIPFFFMHPPDFSVENTISVLFMGIFQIGAASALFAYGIRRVPAVQAMLSAAIEPVLNPLWVLLATGERPPLPVLAGGAVIIAAVLFPRLAGKRVLKKRIFSK